MNGHSHAEELRDLRRAKSLLENRSFAIKLSNLLGLPIDAGFALLPKSWSGTINRAANAALFKALEVAVATTGGKSLKTAVESLAQNSGGRVRRGGGRIRLRGAGGRVAHFHHHHAAFDR